MAQIIKHRRGSLEALSAVTSSLQKGEIVIASGSSNLTVTNGSSLVFAVPADGQVQATNRFLIGDNAPATFAGSTYNGMVKGVPYYASGSSTLYLLGTDGNDAINLVGNIQPFSASVATSINALSASIGGGSIGSAVTALNTFSASQESKDSTLATYTSSVDSKFSTLATYTSSLETKNSTLATYTSSVDGRLNNLESTSASVNSHISDINSYTSSLRTAFTASGANVTFSGNVTIPGNLTVTGTQTIVDSTTVQIGDNILELNGSGAANGGLWVKDATNPNNATGSIIWDSTNDYWKAGVKGSESKVALMGGDNVVTASAQILLNQTDGYSTFSSSLSTNVVELFSTASDHESRIDVIETSLGGGGSLGTRVTNLETFSGSQLTKDSTLETYTSSVDTKFSTIGTYTASLETKNSTLATYTGSIDTTLTNLATKNSTLGTYTASLETKNSTLATYTSSVDGRLNNIESFSGSQNTKNSTLATYTASIDVNIANIHTFTSSFGTTFSSSVDSRLDTLEGTGTIQGVGTGNNVTFAKVTTTGDVIVGGDLVVQGNTVSLNTSTLTIEDKSITLASGSIDNSTADGAGFDVAGTNASFKYVGVTNQFSSSVGILSDVTGSFNLGATAGNSKRIAFRNTNGNLDLVPTASVSGDVLQWNGSDFVMSNTIDGGSF
jgi:hypothetical protein